jgi:hypothetical protein
MINPKMAPYFSLHPLLWITFMGMHKKPRFLIKEKRGLVIVHNTLPGYKPVTGQEQKNITHKRIRLFSDEINPYKMIFVDKWFCGNRKNGRWKKSSI